MQEQVKGNIKMDLTLKIEEEWLASQSTYETQNKQSSFRYGCS